MREKLRRKARRSLFEFTRQAWPIVESGRPFQNNWHIGLVCEHLEAVTKRQIRNLIINIPPRCMKSTLVSVMWHPWVWINKQEESWLFGSYNPKLSTRDAVKSRRIIESLWYRNNWGQLFKPGGMYGVWDEGEQRWQRVKEEQLDSVLRDDQNEKMRYENLKSGGRIATSVGGAGTGDGADIVVVDDPHKAGKVESKVQRENAINWWDDEMSTRGNNPETVCRVVIMQRLHEQDLSGHLEIKGTYEHLVLPMEYEPKYISYVKNPTKLWKDPRTEPGQILWENRISPKFLDDLKKNMSAYQRSGQLQQRPTPKEGVTIKRHFFDKRWTELPPFFDAVVNAWDLTFGSEDDGEGESSQLAFNVGYKIGRRGPDFYVMEEIRERGDIYWMLRALRRLYAMSPVGGGILVENAAAGKSVVAVLKKKIPGVLLVQPQGSKEERADSVIHLFEGSNVIMPASYIRPWADEAVEEMVSFGPRARFKDRVDALVHGLMKLDGAVANDDIDFDSVEKESAMI